MIPFPEYHETIAQLTDCLKEKSAGRRVIAIIDENVERIHGNIFPFEKIVIEATEGKKTIQTVESIISRLMEMGADRGQLLLGIGGGITTDICGFVGCIYKRGVSFGFVPTTLLAMADASIGGKNGVNFLSYKNMVGNIRQPEFICSSIGLLSSLSRKELYNGLPEMLKTFIISGKDFTECGTFFANNDATTLFSTSENREKLQHFITEAAKVKCAIVAEDEHENGKRRILNLGHTYAHALERCTCMPHGEAVAIGIACIARESRNPDTNLIVNTLQSCGLPTEIPDSVTREELMDAMRQDKKIVDGKCHFIVIHAIGDVRIV